MAFQPPRFNLTATIYDFYGPPFLPRHAARLQAPCQIRAIRTALALNHDVASGPGTLLLFPRLTDIRPFFGFAVAGISGDVVEVPAGSARFYVCNYIEDVAKGFLNEHRAAIVIQAPFPGPYPIP